MSRQFVVALIAGLVLCLALVASAVGWLGAPVPCGADGALGCVVWPSVVSFLVWAAFIGGVAALVIWQLRYLDR